MTSDEIDDAACAVIDSFRRQLIASTMLRALGLPDPISTVSDGVATIVVRQDGLDMAVCRRLEDTIPPVGAWCQSRRVTVSEHGAAGCSFEVRYTTNADALAGASRIAPKEAQMLHATDFCDGHADDDMGQGRTRASYEGSLRNATLALVGIVVLAVLIAAGVK